MRLMSMHDHHRHGHGGHGAGGTPADSAAARRMEADIARRFWIAFLFTVPVVLYSPLSVNLFKVALPAPIPVNWLLFALTTPVVFWSGSPFLTGSYHGLRRRQLNMSVLIAVGVLAAYLFSVAITLGGGGETFYEAAAMLVTFVLFGHWMEMKS